MRRHAQRERRQPPGDEPGVEGGLDAAGALAHESKALEQCPVARDQCPAEGGGVTIDELRGRVMGIYAINQSLAILGGLWAGTMGGALGIRMGVASGPMVVLGLILLVALTQRQITGLSDNVDERRTGKRFST